MKRTESTALVHAKTFPLIDYTISRWTIITGKQGEIVLYNK